MTTPRKTLPDLVTQNIPWLIGLGAAAYSGYVTGLTRIDQLEKSVAEVAETVKMSNVDERRFMECVQRRFDHIELKAGPPPPCQLEVPR